MKISKKGRIVIPGAYSWKHQLDGDPDGPIDGDAEDIESSLYMGCKGFEDELEKLEAKEIGKKKLIRKGLDRRILLGIGYLCRNYKLGNLNSEQIEQLKNVMLDLSQLIERLKRNKVKIPIGVTEQLIAMGLLNKK